MEGQPRKRNSLAFNQAKLQLFCFVPPAAPHRAARVPHSLQGGFEQASVLFEWSLSEAISTCMRLAGSRASEVEYNTDRDVTVTGPPLPAITGIAAWDSALLQNYQRRRRAEQVAAAAAVAAEKAAAAEASEISGEDAASAAGASPSTVHRGAKSCHDDVSFNSFAAKGGGKGAETSMVTSLQLLGAAAASATAAAGVTTCATTTGVPLVACAHSDEKDDGNDAGSESTDSTSARSSRAGSSDIGQEDHDSAPECDSQDGDLDSLEHGSGHEVDEDACQRSMTGTNEQQVQHDKLDDVGQGSPGDQDPDEQPLPDIEAQCAELLEEGETPPEGRKPPVVTGSSKVAPPRSRRRVKRLRGFHGALELATRCLRKDGFSAKAYGLRAELEARLGRRDRAIADYSAAASLEVGDPRPRINMVRKDARLAWGGNSNSSSSLTVLLQLGPARTGKVLLGTVKLLHTLE